MGMRKYVEDDAAFTRAMSRWHADAEDSREPSEFKRKVERWGKAQRGWHYLFVPHKRNKRGEPHVALGARIGYWPCLKAPYVQASFFLWRIEVWYGYPSYWKAEDEGPTAAQRLNEKG